MICILTNQSMMSFRFLIGILLKKTCLPDLFDKSKIKNFKDPIGLNEPNLLNFNHVQILMDINVQI